MSGPQKHQRPAGTGRQGKAKDLQSLNDTTASAQRLRLLKRLKHGAISTIEARHELNIMMPAARVKELRDDGHPIATVRVNRADTEGRQHRNVALYTLVGGSK